MIVLVIFGSALVAGYESIDRLIHPQDVHFVWGRRQCGASSDSLATKRSQYFVSASGEKSTVLRWSRMVTTPESDGFTSLGVFGGAMAVWLGFPIADPIGRAW